ncbi:MAG: acetyl-CoA carboxylase biotin carboxylase subunit [Syntrophobacteraceae bacterium]|nr:acetyl-CoA carboxylase biotin carboxylase subunit [Syntrophobacteraceae bacterium]
MIKKILIANRGEIALRIMRACRELGMTSVGVYSEADKDALFARYADEACCIGPAPASMSYLDMEKVIGAAIKSGADAIHPGYGFLAENAKFALACEKQEITFIGPSSRVLELMGDKVAARREMVKAGVPVAPGSDGCVSGFDDARRIAARIGYPVILKPSGGGGGIGMTVVFAEDELQKALESTQAIAGNTFGLADVYVEKYLENPRHVEFQILGDAKGNIVHLGERECSIQRRHQKLIEESPSTALNDKLRKEMGQVAVNAAKWVGYQGAGTVEFLLSEGKFYFLEVNARVQVEHPVTEMVTGIDIVKEQIKIASGLPLKVTQKQIRINGCAIECRINAEDPLDDFVPTPGKIRNYHCPGGAGIRVESGVYANYTIPPYYDPMISKLIAWGADRGEAIARMRRALYEYVITGVKTNLAFHKTVMENPRFVKGQLGTHFIDRETTLNEDMRALMEREKPLAEKLNRTEEKKKVAAIAAVGAVAQMYCRGR